MSENKIGFVVVTYNKPELLDYQIKLINKNCLNTNYEINIVDNSTKPDAISEIAKICESYGVNYTKVMYQESWASVSHAKAFNHFYDNHKSEYNYLFFLDHDLFPIKNFDVIELLDDSDIAGCRNYIKGVEYMFPGCLILKKTDEVINFIPLHGLDTGCQLSGFIKKHKHRFLEVDNKPIGDGKYKHTRLHGFYNIIHNETFIHFIKASNWMNLPEVDFKVREDDLLNVLKTNL